MKVFLIIFFALTATASEDSDVVHRLSEALESAGGSTSSNGMEVTIKEGKNCGVEGTHETIVVDRLSMPDVLVLGANATFAGGITVNKERKSATLLSVDMIKTRWHFRVPCIKGSGSCNYMYPCKYLEQVKCPEEIVAKGWNCRCPIPVNSYSFGPTTLHLNNTNVPALFVNGDYDVTIKLYDGLDELMCYKFPMTVKKLE